MKKINAFLLAGVLFLAILTLIPSCKKEVYTDADALAAMKEGLKYKNDLAKELLALQLTNELQIINLQSQLSIKEMLASDSLNRIGSKTIVSVQVKDVTGATADLSGFSVTVNQSGVATTLTTDINGLVVFPSFVSGSASFVVVKTGFARASGIMLIEGNYNKETTQQAVLVPVFPTESATAKISGTLTAQLDLTTEAKEVVSAGIVSLNFHNIWEIFNDPNSTFGNDINDWGIAAIVYDGGFMQTVKTAADGKYEFKIPKTKNNIEYDLAVSTIQKKQHLLFGDYPNNLDTIKLDTINTWFGYYAGSNNPVFDEKYLGFDYFNGGGTSWTDFAGVNLAISAPEGGQKPTSEANIIWAHNDSTVVTWSFTKFVSSTANEYTKITQDPVFYFNPNPNQVTVVTPTAGVARIEGGKLTSLYMTNGGVYKEYGRNTGAVAPKTAANPQFLFLEQLSQNDAVKWVTDTTYQTAITVVGTPVLKQGKVKIPFTMNRKGKGYTAKPNFEFTVYLNTPPAAGAFDSAYTFTQADVNLNLLTGGKITVDTLVLPSIFKAVNQVYSWNTPVISTYKYAGNWQIHGSSTPVNVIGVGFGYETWKCDLSNGLKIQDGGLGYKTAPAVRIENFAMVQGHEDEGFVYRTIATAATTIDAAGRIISVADPVMSDNLVIRFQPGSRVFYQTNTVSVPVDVDGLVQAYARAMVDDNGTITDILLYNEDPSYQRWGIIDPWNRSGKGYVATPTVKVTPVGKTTVATPAKLQAVVENGRIRRIIIVDGGKGYDVRNNPNAIVDPNNLINYFMTNGESDIQYDIDLGSGYRGDAIDIFNND